MNVFGERDRDDDPDRVPRRCRCGCNRRTLRVARERAGRKRFFPRERRIGSLKVKRVVDLRVGSAPHHSIVAPVNSAHLGEAFRWEDA